MSKNVFRPPAEKKYFSCNANVSKSINFYTNYWLEIQNINAHLNLTYQNMKLIKTEFSLTKIPNKFCNPIIQ